VAFDDTATRSDCPSAKLVRELAAERLPIAEVTGIETHAAGCTTCMARITLARGSRTQIGVEAVALTEHQIRRGTVVGRYVIEHPIGEGGMGVVFSALDKELDRRVAIKLLSQRPGSSSEWRVRLQREARAMARLSHPHIVPIFDIGVTASDQVFIAMELVEGVTLRTWRKTPRAWSEVLEMFRQIGRGLAAVHDAGLVHRDVKPANILIGIDGRARLTDFGVVKLGDERPSSEIKLERAMNPELTRAGSVIGTIPYMAPEQLRGQVADPRTDQFSFCVMLYEALYGENPCAARDPLRLDEWRVPDAPLGNEVPAWARRVVVRGLEADANLRYPTMQALLADLEPALQRAQTASASASLAAPRPNRRALWLVVLALGVVAIATGLLARNLLWANKAVADSCPDPRVELEGAWDAPKKEAIRTAFLATKRPYAATSFASVERIIDRYAERWAAMRTETCVVDNPLVRECLQWRLDELRAQTAAFARADAKVVERAVGAASSLGDLAACSNVAALDARAVKSGPLTDRAQRNEIDELRAKLAQAKCSRTSANTPTASSWPSPSSSARWRSTTGPSRRRPITS
jgi:predicted Ser/Thr protein kinase